MRPVIDMKSQSILGVQDALGTSTCVVKESSNDHFASSREHSMRLTMHRTVPRFQGSLTVWWKDLQPLVDTLPSAVPLAGQELSEQNKEALRDLARSAPHRDVSID